MLRECSEINLVLNEGVEISIEHDRAGSSYSLNIDSKGNVKSNAPNQPANVGRRVTKISLDDLAGIVHEFKDMYFFSFKDNYESPNQSISHERISVSLRLGNKYKRVTYKEDSKVESHLKMLVKRIEKLIDTDHFSAIDD